ncbi:MAG: hypothetical protein AB7P14_00695 [Blastocatellales bacterium]
MDQFITLGESAELFIPGEILKELGFNSGDTVKLDVEKQKLIVRLPNKAELEKRMDEAMDDLMERRRELFERLAEGAE